ncbi:MAG TPA: ATP-binding cassette domain-containing protein, partial [Tissierellaceae bacterium]
KNILENINLNINKNEYISIIGKSGSGKSTLLRLIGSLSNPTSGVIYYLNTPYTQFDPIKLRTQISFSFQNPILLGNIIKDNFEFVYDINNLDYNEKEIFGFLDLFSLSRNILTRSNDKISGGEAQRISLIRNLILKPEVLLLDEITSALDEKNSIIIMDVLKELNKNTTIIQVSHNIEFARRDADYVIELNDGKIINKEEL